MAIDTPVKQQYAKLEIRQSASGAFYWRFRIGGNILNLSANHFHTSGEAEANARRVLGPGWRPDGTRSIISSDRRTLRMPGWHTVAPSSGCVNRNESECSPFGSGEGPTTVLGFCRHCPWWRRLLNRLVAPRAGA